MKPKVKVQNISKTYQLYNKQSDKLLEIFPIKKKENNRNFHALNDVSFEVYEGETVGIVGINGSGKSTLSNILAEVIPPTSGDMEINGETSLIAINVGLNKQLSGLENIELKCIMLGLSKEEIKEITPLIVEFADIGQFIDQPVKNYSSGMKSRLGFAISAYTNPDILIVDEALSVGDKTFYKKCMDKIDEFKASGKTIFFISHSVGQMRSVSDRVLWLHHGKVREYGEANEVLDRYESFVKWFNKLPKEKKQDYKQKRLIEQSVNTSISTSRSKRRTSNDNKLPIAQFAILVLITLISALFMYMDKSPMAIFLESNGDGSYNIVDDEDIERPFREKSSLGEETTGGEVSTESDEPWIPVREDGKISVARAVVYSDEELTSDTDTLAFATHVYILEQRDEVLQIRYNDKIGYLSMSDVISVETEDYIRELNALIFYPILPARLQDSFEYFLSHLNRDYDLLKTRLNGLTEESESSSGNIVLHYEYDNVTIELNEHRVSKGIIVSNISADDVLIEKLRPQSILTSDDDKLMYIPLRGYDAYLDLHDNTLTIVVINN